MSKGFEEFLKKVLANDFVTCGNEERMSLSMFIVVVHDGLDKIMEGLDRITDASAGRAVFAGRAKLKDHMQELMLLSNAFDVVDDPEMAKLLKADVETEKARILAGPKQLSESGKYFGRIQKACNKAGIDDPDVLDLFTNMQEDIATVNANYKVALRSIKGSGKKPGE